MSAADRFFDTNVLLYLLSGDDAKADRAEEVLASGGVISVQVLNEFASVATRKLKMPIAEIREVLATIRTVCKVVPIDEDTHDKGLEFVERYGLSIYDAMIVASALLAGCKALISEDMQGGQIIDGSLEIRNPFG
jgi:predicted nucleic acid-binding protein